MNAENDNEVIKLDARSLTYDLFRENHLKLNKPCIIVNGIEHWRACNRYRCEQFEEYICEDFRDAVVPVLFVGKQNSKDGTEALTPTAYGEEKCEQMNISEYFSMWRGNTVSQNLEKGNLCRKHEEETSGAEFEKMLEHFVNTCRPYLKDWHFLRDFPDSGIYDNPIFFRDDWLNNWCDSTESNDYRFLYCGSRGSFTPLHHDILHSYSWSANIFGKKLWIMYPPSQQRYLMDKYQHSCVSNVLDRAEIDPELYPEFDKAVPIRVIQEEGEIIFIPSGWYHQVVNLEDTLSINHNWFNAYCLDKVSKYLHDQLLETREALVDIRNNRDLKVLDMFFEEKCQQIMQLNIGMNFYQWVELLSLHLQASRQFIDAGSSKKGSECFMDSKSARLSVEAINNVTRSILQDQHLVSVLTRICPDNFGILTRHIN